MNLINTNLLGYNLFKTYETMNTLTQYFRLNSGNSFIYKINIFVRLSEFPILEVRS